MLDITLYVLAAGLMLIGIAGAALPALPGIPLLFAGIWLAAWTDGYRHLGSGWLLSIALLGLAGIVIDLIAASLGAKKIGASPRAISGAAIGTLAGLFIGPLGLLAGPFIGALLGELSEGRGLRRSAHVGLSTWWGLLLGTAVKLMVSFSMLGLFALALFWP